MARTRVRHPDYTPWEQEGRIITDPRALNAVQLAFIGDAVYTLFVRDSMIKRSSARVSQLNRQCVTLVNARAQALALEGIEPLLNENERAIVKRGKNANPGHVPKSASRQQYLQATALEALIGYLHLSGQRRRMYYLMAQAIQKTEEALKWQDKA